MRKSMPEGNTVHRSAALKSVVSVLCILAIVLTGVGTYGLIQRRGAQSETALSQMRVRALLVSTTGEGAIESFVNAAKKKARDDALAAGIKETSELKALTQKAEADVRESMTASAFDFDQVDMEPLADALISLRAAMAAYGAEEAAAQAAYAEQKAAEIAAQQAEEALPAEAVEDIPETLSEDDLLLEEEPKVDLTGFAATPEMQRLQAIVDVEFDALSQALQSAHPILTAEAVLELKPALLQLTYEHGDTFDSEFDRYATNGGIAGLRVSLLNTRIARYGDDMITIGVGLLLLSLIFLFYKQIKRRMGLPIIIIGGFFIFLCMLAMILDLSIAGLLSNSLVRLGMNSIMVLAMLPAIQCGITLNLGLPVGIVGGLIGGLLCIEYGFTGWSGFLFANIVGLFFSGIFGYFYSLLLNRLKGSEMAVTTYVGFSFVSLMCIAWIILPFKSLVLKWPLGDGLKQTVNLENTFKRILDRLFAFKVGGVSVPTGLLLFMVIACFLMWLFSRTKTGVAMQAVGNNPRFAEAAGINVDRMRIIGTTLSTMLGSVGILVYSQSYGYMQLYAAPRSLGLIAASAILLGGASTTRARISHVLIGTFLFHSILTLSIPVANELIPGSTIAEILRLLISNGIILYALTKSGGESRA